MSPTTRRTTHRLMIDAPEALIFTMLRDSSHWPDLAGLTDYAERVSGDDSSHDLRTSVVVNGSLSSSHCHRIFDADGRHAGFRQLGLEAPPVHLGGDWEIRPSDGGTVVTLNHEFEVEADDEGLSKMIHANIVDFSRRELEALRLSCERLARLLQQPSTGAAAANAAAREA